MTMLRLLTLSTLTLLLCFPATGNAEPKRYIFDKAHTAILFFVNHLGFSDTVGRFTDYDGFFIFDEETPENSLVEVKLRPAGIRTPSPELDVELQNDKWFHTEKFPEILFKSTKVVRTGRNTADVIGWVTMLDQTQPVTLHVTFNKSGVHPINNKRVAGFSANTEINRSHFGMINYVPMIGEKVRLVIETEGFEEAADTTLPEEAVPPADSESKTGEESNPEES
ncbi:MAG: polyisoprenoid-binding protein [Hyphomicrobiales bacterium]|nr:polyisoprenoid-binding protein [Hyphomicrobiales bacterium]